jgi:hypothetical protein
MSEVFDGTVDVQDGNGNTTVLMDGTRGSLNVGGCGQDGSIHVDDTAGTGRIFLGADGSITSRDAAAGTVFGLYGDGQLYIRRLLAADYITVFEFLSPQGSLSIGGESTSGSLTLRNTDGDEAAVIDGHEGDVTVSRDIDGTLRDVLTFAGATATLRIGSEDNGGDLILSDSAGRDVLHLEAERAAVFIGAAGNEGDLIVRDGEGRQVVHLGGDKAVVDVGAEGNEGDVRVFDADGDLRIHLDGASGNVNLLGADCAEDFTVRDAARIEPGSVLVIDDAGQLRESAAAYDRRVAGVVSGGGSFGPGIVLDKQRGLSDRKPVALIGKVYCKVDADAGAVAVGDLLTTAATPGHAMKAADPQRAFGAVIGKALAPLPSGRGLIPILVALQ